MGRNVRRPSWSLYEMSDLFWLNIIISMMTLDFSSANHLASYCSDYMKLAAHVHMSAAD